MTICHIECHISYYILNIINVLPFDIQHFTFWCRCIAIIRICLGTQKIIDCFSIIGRENISNILTEIDLNFFPASTTIERQLRFRMIIIAIIFIIMPINSRSWLINCLLYVLRTSSMYFKIKLNNIRFPSKFVQFVAKKLHERLIDILRIWFCKLYFDYIENARD